SRGVAVERVELNGSAPGVAWSLAGGSRVQAVDERVPGDISAAAFWLVAGSIHPDAELTLRGVGLNPTRRAAIDLLRRMGADIDELPTATDAHSSAGSVEPNSGSGEPTGDLVVRSAALEAIEIGPVDVAMAIDEIPALCLAAS